MQFLIFVLGLVTPFLSGAASLNERALILAGATDLQNPKARSWVSGSAFFKLNEDPIPLAGGGHADNRLSGIRRAEIEAFASAHLKEISEESLVFYPFGGADFIYPSLFYPRMESLVLVGLEGIGSLPAPEKMNPDQRLQLIQDIGTAISSLPLRTFYVTQSMSTQFKNFGVTTMLMVGIVLAGYEVTDVARVAIKDDSSMVLQRDRPSEFQNSKTKGVRVSYRQDGSLKNVYYFQQDLSDGAFDPKGPLGSWLQSQGERNTFLKAASYILFERRLFSRVTRFILDGRSVLQADSGVPYDLLLAENLDISLFGTYSKPSTIFGGRSDHWQKALLTQYEEGICSSGDAGQIHTQQLISWHDGGKPRDICRDIVHSVSSQYRRALPFVYDYSGWVEVLPRMQQLIKQKSQIARYFPETARYLEQLNQALRPSNLIFAVRKERLNGQY